MLESRVESVEDVLVMKEFLVAMMVAAALLIPFRDSNGRFELSDLERFAHLCTQACAHICSVRR